MSKTVCKIISRRITFKNEDEKCCKYLIIIGLNPGDDSLNGLWSLFHPQAIKFQVSDGKTKLSLNEPVNLLSKSYIFFSETYFICIKSSIKCKYSTSTSTCYKSKEGRIKRSGFCLLNSSRQLEMSEAVPEYNYYRSEMLRRWCKWSVASLLRPNHQISGLRWPNIFDSFREYVGTCMPTILLFLNQNFKCASHWQLCSGQVMLVNAL